MATPSYSYMKFYRKRRTAERYKLAVEYLGGCCAHCGVDSKFEFDHIIRGTRLYAISTHLWDYSWEKLKLELDKCQLLCIPCHKKKTNLEVGKSVEHGKGKSGKRNCKCSPCKARKAEYMRNYIRIR